MRKNRFDNRIPKYFHSDGNGIHLKVGKEYKVMMNGKFKIIKVLKEHRHFYLAEKNGLYKFSISKYQEDFEIL